VRYIVQFRKKQVYALAFSCFMGYNGTVRAFIYMLPQIKRISVKETGDWL
jgi:hypothetical protein